MIITRSWLQEWIDIRDISTEDLAKTFNQIGLEVDRVVEYKMPEKVVFAKVVECKKHPEADKLNICQVDLGSSIRQIVCGASNVREGLIVAAATLGAKMPSGMEIKPVKLRGVDSDGMICSASELGLVDFSSGILEIDSSIGEVKLGDEIGANPYFNDDLIELELTANRGDCLSIMGVARDLAAAFNKSLKLEQHEHNMDENHIGIGRILQVTGMHTEDVSLAYHAVELKNIHSNMLIEMRLAQVEEVQKNTLDSLLYYATYSTGVILRAYDKSMLSADEKAKIVIEKEKNGYSVVKADEIVSIIGVSQSEASKVKGECIAFIEASYVLPDVVSKNMFESKIEKDALFYRTSRGSEPNLKIGIDTFLNSIQSNSDSKIYSGSIETDVTFEKRVISIDMDEINSIVGMEIEKRDVSAILQDLGFDITKSQSSSFVVGIPQYRHDIVNKQDIIEEIVRLLGIDNIQSKPFEVVEAKRFNDDYIRYQKRREYRHKAANSGFFESVHFIFNEAEQLKKYGFKTLTKDLALLNPIVNTLDTLRPTLLMGLLNAASMNKKGGKKCIPLFEIGSVFAPDRKESLKMALLFSGEAQSDKVINSGKPQVMDFAQFTQKVSDIIGEFELINDDEPMQLAHPYQAAKILKDDKVIGSLFKLHPSIQDEFDLEATFMCEIDFDALDYSLKVAKKYSKFQASYRDLSLVVSKERTFTEIKEIIESSLSKEIVRFYPIDRYHDEKLGENMSLTLRFVLQSNEKTLEEDDITRAMSSVLDALEVKLGVTLR